uniref:chaperonin GroEL n=1 Tax=Porphyridium aerugineum TaxID=2792 RepID=UPI001FCCC381|nr:chaperonin GroEL [Porphyridium aerugineum]UNJ17918.1 chaperonin GroEL [Porphyridium aerugineum]
MIKKILFKNDARSSLIEGMEILNQAVAVTIGPKGKNVVLANIAQAPQIINDGITIAKEIKLKDKAHNIGVSLIRQATAKTNEIAGDGTTTSTILAYSIIKEGIKNIEAGTNPVILRQGINKASKYIISKVIENATPITNLESIYNIAYISSGNNDEIANNISQAIQVIGRDGLINLDEGRSTKIELEISEGLTFNKGFASSYFLKNTNSTRIIQEKPYVLIIGTKINSAQEEILPILNKIKNFRRPLLIIAEDIDTQVIATLVVNNIRNIADVVLVRAPGIGNQRTAMLEDLSILTQSKIVGNEAGIPFDQLTINDLGTASKIIISKDKTTIINEEKSQAIKNRCDQLRTQLKLSDSLYEKQNLKDRLAKLSGGVATIKVGAVTNTEMQDKKLRLEDAINAVRSAILEGIVPGGGNTLLHLSHELLDWANHNLKGDELIGASLFAKALLLPAKQIINNAGENGSLLLQKVKSLPFEYGYDSLNKEMCNMLERGIIDPAKVTRSAIQNAASIASIVLSTECVVFE